MKEKFHRISPPIHKYLLLQRLFEHKKKRISFLSQVFKNDQRLYLNIKAVNQCRHYRKVERVCLLLIKVYSCKIK